MSRIVVHIPINDVDQLVEVEVKINGKAIRENYRVETFDLEYTPDDATNYIEQLRDVILRYDENWELFHIGPPSENKIPITFKERKTADVEG